MLAALLFKTLGLLRNGRFRTLMKILIYNPSYNMEGIEFTGSGDESSTPNSDINMEDIIKEGTVDDPMDID